MELTRRHAAVALAVVCVLAAAALGVWLVTRDSGGAERPAVRGPLRDDRSQPLVYVVVIDGMRGDAIAQAPFLRGLSRGSDGASATRYTTSRAVMVAQTNPNHVAMATGAYGAASGVPANSFAVHAKTDSPDSCPAPGAPAVTRPQPTTGEDPRCLQAETMFAVARRQGGSAPITTAGIFGKPKLARIFSGSADGRGGPGPDHLWTPCVPGPNAGPYCRDVPTDDDQASDATVMDEVLRTVREGVEAGGARRRPNMTFVNLPRVDHAGHTTGTGTEYAAAVATADGQIRRFVDQQKQLGLWDRTVLFVVSDHGMDATHQNTSLDGAFDRAGIPRSDYVLADNGGTDLIYLTDPRRPDRDALLKRMRTVALGLRPTGPRATGVDEALYREPDRLDGGTTHTLGAVHPDWHLGGDRVGDLVVTHRAGGLFSDESAPVHGAHGGPTTRNNLFLVAGGGRDVREQTIGGTSGPRLDDTRANPRSAENVDIAPTVMRLLGRRAPRESQGRFLSEAFDLSRLPGRGRSH